MKSLDPKLDDAILRIARTIFPNGYHVSDNAPSTYRDLIAHMDSGKKMMVCGGGCDHTIYGSPKVNHALRAWHDYCHWIGRLDFSLEGEMAVWRMQCIHLYLACGRTLRTRTWAQILHAEIVGQGLYFQRHDKFLSDQRSFVEQFLQNPEAALTTETPRTSSNISHGEIQ